jgi:hypothetical protein
MKRTTLFAALASALSLAACAHGIDRQNQGNAGTDANAATSAASGASSAGSQGEATRRIPAAKGESQDTPAQR